MRTAERGVTGARDLLQTYYLVNLTNMKPTAFGFSPVDFYEEDVYNLSNKPFFLFFLSCFTQLMNLYLEKRNK